ncbi:MAG: PHP domain-containing protein [Dehalococcoidia bacterium]|nr:PHP domain-containing protein [Dehalococcoidia bacterium]
MTNSEGATGKADLHTHTNFTDGMMDVRSLLDHFQERTDVDVVAITDHDDITAGLAARDLAERHRYRFQVIVGCEVTTLSGHLIGLFLESPLPRLRSMEKTLQAIHRQGGLAIAPHPLSWLTFSLGERALRRAGQSQETGVYFDGIETANPSLAAQVVRERVVRLNRETLGLAEIGASDAHFLAAAGSGITHFLGRTPEDLRRAILDRQTAAESFHVPLSHIGYGALVRQQVRSLVMLPARSAIKPLRRLFGGGRVTPAPRSDASTPSAEASGGRP